jgi:hypothetical protein
VNPGTDWIDQARRLLDLLRAGDPTADGEHSSDCRWCPICQVASVVRGERPEVSAAIADVLTATATALRTFAEAAAPANAPDAPEAAADEGDPTPPVQQIEIA